MNFYTILQKYNLTVVQLGNDIVSILEPLNSVKNFMKMDESYELLVKQIEEYSNKYRFSNDGYTVFFHVMFFVVYNYVKTVLTDPEAALATERFVRVIRRTFITDNDYDLILQEMQQYVLSTKNN